MVTPRTTTISSHLSELVTRHGLVTPRMLHVAGFVEDSVKRTLRRGVRKGCFVARDMGPIRYYQFPGSRELGPQTLPIRYAVAMHCAEFGLTRPGHWEMRLAFPFLTGVEVATDADGLYVLKVDVGGKPDAHVRRALELHRKLGVHAAYREHLDARRIRFRILTATERKAKEINWYINRANSPVPIEYAIVPGYEQVLGGIDHA